MEDWVSSDLTRSLLWEKRRFSNSQISQGLPGSWFSLVFHGFPWFPCFQAVACRSQRKCSRAHPNPSRSKSSSFEFTNVYHPEFLSFQPSPSVKKRPPVSFHATAKPALVATAAARPFPGNAKLCDRFTNSDSPVALQNFRSIFWLQMESPFCQTICSESTSPVGMAEWSESRRGRLTEQSHKVRRKSEQKTQKRNRINFAMEKWSNLSRPKQRWKALPLRSIPELQKTGFTRGQKFCVQLAVH